MAVIIYFVITKKNSSDKNSLLETEEEKIEKLNYNLTFITPKKVFGAIRKENYLIIDTRNNQDFIENHIESSINIPLENFIEKKFQLNKEKNLIFIEKEETQDGKKIANQLKENGYKLNYLKGGLYGYLGAGYDLISYGDVNSAQDRAKVNLIDLATLGNKLISGERFIYLDVRL
jgi:rhodanese-related sulfurtransferase